MANSMGFFITGVVETIIKQVMQKGHENEENNLLISWGLSYQSVRNVMLFELILYWPFLA